MKNISYLIIFFTFFKPAAQVLEKQSISPTKNKAKEIFMPTYGLETLPLKIELCKTEKVPIISDFFSKYPYGIKIKELGPDNVKDKMIAYAIELSNYYHLDRVFFVVDIIAFSKITEKTNKIVRSPYINAFKAPYFLA